MGLSGTAGPTPVHLLRPYSEVQLITLKTPSFPTSHPHKMIIITFLPSIQYLTDYLVFIFLRGAINHIENTLFSNLHPYPHPHLHYLIIIFPSFKPQNTITIISDVQLKPHRKHLLFQPPSLSSSSLALSHDYLSLIQTSKYNHHLRCAINHIENTLFSNLHPYPHHHLHYLIIIFPTIKPQNTATIISDAYLIFVTNATSIFV